MNIRTDLRMDKPSFFTWLERQERHYELVDGVVTMMAYVTRNHALICTNVIALLLTQLDRASFNITQGDFAVSTGERSIRYADVMVEPAGGDGHDRSTDAALLLVEVLSDSTMHTDFGAKLDEYRRLPSLAAYLIIAQSDARAWLWIRADGVWSAEPEIFEGRDAIATIPALGVTLPLRDIYQSVAAN